MSARLKEATNVTLIRAPRSREAHNPLPFLFRDRTNELIDRWQAPLMGEREIEAWATRYLMCPRTGMSFVEFLIVNGIGMLAAPSRT